MELNIFMRELESALVQRGIPNEVALRHVSNLRRTFTSDDLSEIEAIHSVEEIEELADSISVILNKNKRNSPPQPAHAVVPAAHPAPVHAARPAKAVPDLQRPPVPDVYENDISYEPPAEPEPSTKGMLVFWIGLFVTLPITLGLLAGIFGSFAAVFIALAGLIVGGVGVLIALVAAGAGVSLVGIIFGITQLFSFLSAGIYEIGLGVMVAGVVLFVAVLIYNFSIRFVPWVITWTAVFVRFVCRKLKSLFFMVRRECYKL